MMSDGMDDVQDLVRIRERWGSARIFVVAALLAIVAGGLVAALSRPLGWGHGPWAAAYLVLVAGTAQFGLGAGQAWLAPMSLSRRLVITEFLAFNFGNALVIVGTLLSRALLVDAGAGLLIAALVLFIVAMRYTKQHQTAPGWARLAYLMLVFILLVSIPVGVMLMVITD